MRRLPSRSYETAPLSELRDRFVPNQPVTAGELEKLERLEMLDQVNGGYPGKESDETGRVADEENGPPAWPEHDPDADTLQDDDDAAPV